MASYHICVRVGQLFQLSVRAGTNFSRGRLGIVESLGGRSYNPSNMPARKLVVDIETIPCADELRHLIPEAVLWKRIGNRLLGRGDPGEKLYRRTSLNWTFGRIVCIGILIELDDHPVENHALVAEIHPTDTLMQSLAKEAEVLRNFWQLVLPDDYFIGHNILTFDLPFLWNRSIVCNVAPSRPLCLEQGSTCRTFDTMLVWSHWPTSSRGGAFVGLNTLTRVMGLRGKTGTGNQVYELWRQNRFTEIRDYCLADVTLEYELYRRLTLSGAAPVLKWDRSSCE